MFVFFFVAGTMCESETGYLPCIPCGAVHFWPWQSPHICPVGFRLHVRWLYPVKGLMRQNSVEAVHIVPTPRSVGLEAFSQRGRCRQGPFFRLLINVLSPALKLSTLLLPQITCQPNCDHTPFCCLSLRKRYLLMQENNSITSVPSWDSQMDLRIWGTLVYNVPHSIWWSYAYYVTRAWHFNDQLLLLLLVVILLILLLLLL